MALHIVRHAEAGVRPAWDGPDDLRPLTDEGWGQAHRLADHLASFPVKRILSSRFARCTQSVEPLAARLGIDVETVPALAEDARIEASWALLADLAGTEAVLCSHGNVIGALLDRLHRRGVDLVADEWSCKKGSIWSIDVGPGGNFAAAHLALERA
ncbi:MAG TPA: phosphoglycerate mutase family protein [Acidimicrobiales bacterium]|nr:phosphoglycerate mutase family protein [Acidimicrobiales bacterium]